jgi:predicted component of type VI protein secretion system
MAKLVVLTDGFTGLSLEVKPEKTRVGRVEDNQFCIAEPSVSSHHCEVWLKGDDVMVRDLSSTNGTFVNETQIAPEKDTPLRPGQILRLGQVQLRHETGKRQTDAQRQTIKIAEAGQTVTVGKGSPFAKKSNNANKIFLAIGAVLVLVIIGSLVYVFFISGVGPSQGQ